MKCLSKLTLRTICLIVVQSGTMFSASSIAHAAGGPDAWGYTWRFGGELGAAPFDWVDISSIGTPISSLADSTSSEAIDLGMDFQWYWSTHSEIYVGANGWAGFNPDTHLAPCFPAIPTAGDFNDFLAPFLADLTLAGEGNPGRVLTWRDEVGERFVISWLNVPFRNPAHPSGFEGNNSFQLILNEDGRVRFQYLNIDADLMATRTDCGFSSLIGMENITGNIGLEVWSGIFDESIQTVEFWPPEVTTFLFADPAPAWIFTPSSRGRIVEVGVPFDIEVGVRNYGNAAVPAHTAQVSVTQGLDVRDTFTLDSPALPSLASSTLPPRSVTLSEAGAHTVTITTASAADINPSNNRKLADLQVVSFDDGPVRLSWATTTDSDVDTTELVGGRVIAGFQSPRAPLQVLAVEGVVQIRGDFSAAGIFVSVLDDDGPFGGPGTELARANALESLTFTEDGWASVALATPVYLDDGSFYVAFESDSPNVTIRVENTPPFSLQTWEDVDGLGPYRSRYSGDFLLGALVEPVPLDPGGEDAGLSDAGGVDAGASDAGDDSEDGTTIDAADGTTTDDVEPGDVATDTESDTTVDVDTQDSPDTDGTSDSGGASDTTTTEPDVDQDGQGGDDTIATDTANTGDSSGDSGSVDALNDSMEGSDGEGSAGHDDDDDNDSGGGCSTAASDVPAPTGMWMLGLLSLWLPRRKK